MTNFILIKLVRIVTSPTYIRLFIACLTILATRLAFSTLRQIIVLFTDKTIIFIQTLETLNITGLTFLLSVKEITRDT